MIVRLQVFHWSEEHRGAHCARLVYGHSYPHWFVQSLLQLWSTLFVRGATWRRPGHHLHRCVPADNGEFGELRSPSIWRSSLGALGLPKLPSSSTKIRRSSPCHPTFFYLWDWTAQHRLPPTTPTRSPPCSSPAQRLPEPKNDESRFQHPVDHFTSCILRSQSFDDVTTRNLSEDVLDIHLNVDPCHMVWHQRHSRNSTVMKTIWQITLDKWKKKKKRQSAPGKHHGKQTKPQFLNWTETCDKKNKHRIIDVNNDEIFFNCFTQPRKKWWKSMISRLMIMITIAIYHTMSTTVHVSWLSAFNWCTITYLDSLQLCRSFQCCTFLWSVCRDTPGIIILCKIRGLRRESDRTSMVAELALWKAHIKKIRQGPTLLNARFETVYVEQDPQWTSRRRMHVTWSQGAL